MPDRVALALRTLDDAIEAHQPAHVYALFSGGSDSLVAAHVASRHPAFSGCLFVDTGTALPGVVEHVRERLRDPGVAAEHPDAAGSRTSR